MEKSKVKYDSSFKTRIMSEFFRGASAKDLSEKYGVKERTIYSWSKRARERITVTPNTTDAELYQAVKGLEERLIKIEKQLELINKIFYR